MSYEVAITLRASSQLQRLDVWLQEEVIEELEELADDPPTAPGLRVYRMIRIRGADVEVVLLRLLVDTTVGKITLLGVST